jgi:hypothetical protein
MLYREGIMCRRFGVFSTAFVFVLLVLQGCGGGGGGGGENAGVDSDTDGDGLTDTTEAQVYGTSPVKVDTDGDGISDYDEIFTYSFNADLNNYQYNPLIADVPSIDIEVLTAPDISLNYEFSDSTTASVGTSRATSNTSGVTTSRSNSNSTAVETAATTGQELSIGAELEITFGPPTLSVSVTSTSSYSFTNTTSSERSFGWTAEQSSENSNTYEQVKSTESGNSVSAAAGTIAAAVKVTNNGARSFTLNNLTLSAYMMGSDGSILAPINNLNIDNELQEFPQTSLSANTSTGSLIFAASSVNAATVKSLLSNSTGMRVGIASYELVDINGVPFVFAQEKVNASTATVIIDYDIGGNDEKFFVSTVADPATLTITAKEAMENILKLPFLTEADGRLLSVNGTAGNTAALSWLVMHKTSNGLTESTTIYKYANAYDFNNITLKAGDVLHMVYQIDADGDGLGRRLEALLGTDENNSDSDGDGISDYDEMFTGWQVTYPGGSTLWVTSSPTKLDTDGDGLADQAEMTAQTDPRNKDTDGDYLNDSQDPDPLVYDQQLYAQSLQSTFTDVDIATGDAAISWGHVWAGNVNSGRDIILRQISSSAAFGQALPDIATSATQKYTTIGGWLACGATANCWEVVGQQAVSSSDGIGTYTFTDSGVDRTLTYKYAVVTEFTDGANYFYIHNDAGSIVDAATTGSLKRVTITMNLVTLSADCTDVYYEDEFSSYRISDCEPYYTADFNGKTIASRYSTAWQPNIYSVTCISGVCTGSLNPVQVLWQNSGTNTWVDATHPDTAKQSGTATWYVDVIDTTTSVPITFTAGERDIGENHPADDGLDELATLTVNVSTNNLAIGTNATGGSTVSWGGAWWDEAGSIQFSYGITVTAAP